MKLTPIVTLTPVFLSDRIHTAQAVQTDGTAESAANTQPDWEVQVAAMLEHGSKLTEEYSRLVKKQEEEEAAKVEHKRELQKMMKEALHQQQVIETNAPALSHRLDAAPSVLNIAVFSASAGKV